MHVVTIGSSVSESQGQKLVKEFDFSRHIHISISPGAPILSLEQEIEVELKKLTSEGKKPITIIDFCNLDPQPDDSRPADVQVPDAAVLLTSTRKILDVLERVCGVQPILLSSFREREGLAEELRALSDGLDDFIIEMPMKISEAADGDHFRLAPEEISLLNRKIRSKFALLSLDPANLRAFQLAKGRTAELLEDSSDQLQVRDGFTCGELAQHFCYQGHEIDDEKPLRLTIFFNGAMLLWVFRAPQSDAAHRSVD